MPLINANRVEEILRDCLFTDDEIGHSALSGDGIEAGRVPADAVPARGIMNNFMFHAGRLDSHRAEIEQMLMNLPESFMRSKGGGMSFLQACQDRADEQWTGLHLRMDQLFVLGIAIGKAEFLMPREMWSILPGGMPYLVVEDGQTEQADDALSAATG